MAQYALGSAYLSGQGALQDDRQAFLWTEKAANQDLGVAVYRLSQMYRAGKGVKTDPGKARQFALKADEIAEREMKDGLSPKQTDEHCS
jgi:TPR repeat protein